jgi:hypothetical protein
MKYSLYYSNYSTYTGKLNSGRKIGSKYVGVYIGTLFESLPQILWPV